jgi:hypothetical protein
MYTTESEALRNTSMSRFSSEERPLGSGAVSLETAAGSGAGVWGSGHRWTERPRKNPEREEG